MPMFVPTDDELVLTKFAVEQTQGGILLPQDDDAKDRNGEYVHPVGRGVVVAIGPGRYNPQTHTLVPAMPTLRFNHDTKPGDIYRADLVAGVKVGDVVYYQKRVAYEIRHEGVTYLVVDAQRVLGVIPQA